MAVIAPGYMRCGIEGHWSNGRQIVNVLDMQVGDPPAVPSQSDLETVARDVFNNWQDHVMPNLPDNYALDVLRYFGWDEFGIGGVLEPDPAKAVIGGSVTAQAPINTSLLVKKIGQFPRGRRPGRWFLPVMPEGSLNEDGLFDTAYVTGWNTNLASFETGISDVGPPVRGPVVIHTEDIGTEAEPNIVFRGATPVTAFLAQQLAATQRRRMRP